MHRSKAKIVLLVLLPAILSLSLSLGLVTIFVQAELKDQREHFTRAIVNQLAASTADYLITEDLLGLNIVLGTLVSEGDLIFASVSNTNNELLAQAGKNGAQNQDMVTRDISFQNETAGYLRVIVNQSILNEKSRQIIVAFALLHFILLSAVAIVVWYFADFIFMALFSAKKPTTGKIEPISPSKREALVDDNDRTSASPADQQLDTSIIMVMKIRPQRWLATHEDKISRALSLYRCKVEVSEGQDIIAIFTDKDSRECLYDAICAGLLLIQVFERLNTTINIKIGINIIANEELADTLRKQTVYLASIAEHQLLVSSDAYEICGEDTRIVITEYHNSLTPTSSVFLVESLQPAYQKLIELQADKLSKA